MPRRDRRRTMYQPLVDYLARQTGSVVRLSFSSIEEILAFSLPPSAQTTSSWWRKKASTWVRAWQAAGWEASVSSDADTVIFTRLRNTGKE